MSGRSKGVTTVRLAYLLALLLGCDVVHAACEIEPGHYGPRLSESAAQARNDFYQSECIRAAGRLVDSTDPTLKGRLGLPRALRAPNSAPYERLARELGITRSPMVALILDASGSVQNVALIASCGNKHYDAAIVELARKIKSKPITLDGMPIPALVYMRYHVGLERP